MPAGLGRWLEAELARPGGELLGAGYQGTVRRYASPYGEIVVKAPRDGAVLGALGRRALEREHRVYERLRGIPGVPRCFGLLDGKYLVLEHIDGPSYRDYESKLAHRERFFAALLDTIDAMHAAGVAHGDLKRKDNLLVGPGERPYLVDFGIARVRRGAAGREDRLFRWIAQMDLNAWIKLKYRKRVDALSAEDAARYAPLLLERVARWIRIPWQKITLRRPRQRWRRRREQRR